MSSKKTLESSKSGEKGSKATGSTDRSEVLIESAEKASSSKSEEANSTNSIKAHFATKRSARELMEPKDWKPLIKRVFVTKGEGDLRENVIVKGGAQKSVFSIVGTCSDNKVVVLQVWGVHAKKISDLFKKMALPDFAPTLWVIPSAPAKGLFFREMKANDYQVRAYGASFTLVLEYALKESEPRPDLTKDAYPSLFAWADGNFAIDNARIPHYSMWGQVDATANAQDTSELDDYCPPIRTYEEASPLKAIRTSSVQSTNGKQTDLSFDNDE